LPARRLTQSPESLKSSTIETDSPFIENKHEGLSWWSFRGFKSRVSICACFDEAVGVLSPGSGDGEKIRCPGQSF